MKKSLLILLSVCISATLLATPPAKGLPIEKIIRLSNGINMRFVQQGKGRSTPVILLHGFSDSWHSFEKVLPLLPDSIPVYAVSMRGHGLSDKPRTGYSPLDMASDIALFMDAMQIQKAYIVGHSLGATVAQSFFTSFPCRTQGLILVAAFASYGDKAAVTELQQFIHTMKVPDKSFAEEFQKSTITKPVGDDFLTTAVRESMKLPLYVWRSVIDELVKTNLLDDIARQPVKSLIIWGDKDVYAPLADQEKLRNALKVSSLIRYEGTGHAVHWEDPERFAIDLVRFMQLTR
jgi:non-heme chloroperoxidase